MSALGTTNSQSILSQAQSQIEQILKLTEGQGGQGSASVSSYVNSVWGITEGIEQLSSADDSQKASVIQNLLTKVTDLIGNLGTKDAAKANQEVNKNNQAINKNENEANQTSITTNSKLQEIMNQCESNTDSIQKAMEKIQELGGDDSQIASAQEELDKQLAIIEENKKVLNDETSDKDSRIEALRNILNASAEIKTLDSTVTDALAQIEEQNCEVESNTDAIADLTTQAVETYTEGTQTISENITEAQQLGTENVQMQVKSAQETTIGTTQIAIGEAMSSNMFTSSEGVKYEMSGNDKLSAGSTYMSGSIQGLAALTQSIGSMGGYLSEFANMTNSIGQYTENSIGLIGDYDTTVNSIIESVGSWDVVTDANDELQAYVEEYSSEIPENEGESTDESSEQTESNDETQNPFKKFEFDTSVFNA